MPTTMIATVKRKPGLTPEASRHDDENHDSRLGMELFGHLRASCRRNHILEGRPFAQRGQGPAVIPPRGDSGTPS